MPLIAPRPYWQTQDRQTVRLYHGDVLEVLRRLPGGAVQCVVTSPPYWGLRDYGTGTWTGGDPACKHSEPLPAKQYLGSDGKLGTNNTNWDNRHSDKRVCPKCGAVRTDRQLGSEARPDCLGWARGENCAEQNWETGCHVCRMVLVFREVRRVLRDDGTLWLNYGDTWSGGSGTNSAKQQSNAGTMIAPRQGYKGLPPGNLVGVPWRVALALQADGWVLRQDIIWHKPSPMPESVRNRCTKAHEYVFLLTKSNRYFCDMEAIKEPNTEGSVKRFGITRGGQTATWNTTNNKRDGRIDGTKSNEGFRDHIPNGANKRSVWSVSSSGYPGAHFATFPPKLIEPMILAGTSAHGACADCGAPWRRVTERTALTRERPNDYVKRTGEEGTGNSCANSVAGVDVETVGWEPSCECHGRQVRRKVLVKGKSVDSPVGGVKYTNPSITTVRPQNGYSDKDRWVTVTTYQSDLLLDEHPITPCVVLDPFLGSGTTAAVSVELGRAGWGIELSEQYLRNNAIVRIEGILYDLGLTHLRP